MKQFIRNFKKQRTVGLLNICSLSLGIMVAIIVGIWAINELSFDRFHKSKDRIYRTVTNYPHDGNTARVGSTWFPFGKQAQDELPVIEDMCRVLPRNDEMRIDNVLYTTIGSFMVDPNFFTFFTFPLKEGDPNQVLSAPDRVIISESAAAIYFPEKNPMGQIIKYQWKDFVVSGIMKDIPKNSSLQTDFVFPFFGWLAESSWGNLNHFITFFLLREGIKADALTGPMTQILHSNFELIKNMEATYSLEPLSDMHFSSSMLFDPVIKGNKPLLMIFVVTALMILIISCINFINLFVSTSFIRAKTIGIKKTVGAKKFRLMREFYLETACYVVLAIGIGLELAMLITPVFNNFTQSSVSLDFGSPRIYVFLAVLFLFVVLLAGSFPALYMTRFNVLETLYGKFKGKKMSLLQKSLVVVQFTTSIALLIVVGFMQKQVNYILAYDLGFNKEHVLYVEGRHNFTRNYKSLEEEFLREPSITAVSRKIRLPSEHAVDWPVKRVPEDNAKSHIMDMCFVSSNYFDFFDMKIIDGENPFFLESGSFFLESSEIIGVVINEKAAQILGYEHPVSEMIETEGKGKGLFGNKRLIIKGVVRDAYTKSLHQEIDPQVYIKLTDDAQLGSAIFFKTNDNPQQAIRCIEQKWKEREGDYPFEYRFLDDTYKQLYTGEMNAGKVFTFALLITLIITVAGLFAMAYYATQRRVREIAIRKVYGASVKDLFVLLNRNFVLWVVLAFALACPVAWYALHKWLEKFVVKASLNIWIFLSVGAIALLITLFTTGYQTWKVATENPVKSLKIE